jgi:tripartite-type tricarboxylate transporter receptor subunit TctC
VPFKGTGETVIGLMSNQVDVALLITPSVVSHIEAGKLRALAVTGPQRLSVFPSLPTFDEAGLRGFAFNSWTGVAAPAGTPKEVIATLYAQIREAIRSPGMQPYYA